MKLPVVNPSSIKAWQRAAGKPALLLPGQHGTRNEHQRFAMLYYFSWYSDGLSVIILFFSSILSELAPRCGGNESTLNTATGS